MSSQTSAGPSAPQGQSSWLSYLTALTTTQSGRLVLTAAASCAATAASIFSYQAALRVARRKDLARRVDKATHREPGTHYGTTTTTGSSSMEKSRSHPGREDDDGEGSIDGGTPRYLDHLSHLTPSRSQTLARAASPLRRQSSRTSLAPARTSSSRPAPQAAYDESLIREQLSRNFSFVGDEAMARLRSSFVIVVGLGGVGSHVALSLIRSGVGHVRLIDFDQVSLSSLNRHAVATLEDVGRPKVIVCQEHFRGIAPWVQIQAWVDVFNENEAGRLLSPFPASSNEEIPPTYVIDCIDNLNTKVGLLAYCHHHNIKVFSSMGAGAKCDPTRICIGDLTATEEDPLAKSVRRRLRERGIPMLVEREEKGPSAEEMKRRKEEKKAKMRAQGPRSGGGAGGERREGSNATLMAQQTPPRKGGATAGSTSTQTTPRPPTFKDDKPAAPVPSTPQSSRRISESRRMSRASSMSSFGSGEGAFFTPQGTPKEEEADWGLAEDQQQVQPPEFKLDDNEDEEKDDATLNGRPDLSRLHRASSGLEELSTSPMAEKTEGEAAAAAGSSKSRSSSHSRSQSRSRSQSSLRPPGSLVDVPEAQEAATTASTDPATPASDPSATTTTSATASSPWTSSNPHYLIPCIFSTEKPSARLLPLDEAEFAKDGGVEMLRALEDGNDWRVRTLPVLGPLPAIFGLSIAAFVICDIGGREELLMEPLQNKLKKKTGERSLKDLEACERLYPSPVEASSSGKAGARSSAGGAIATSSSKKGIPAPSASASRHSQPGRSIPFLLDDVVYLIVEVFHNRSVVPPFPSISSSHASLLRWDSTLPLSFSNVALFTKEQAKVHQEEVLKRGRSPVEVWGEEARKEWGRRMEEERWYARFR